MSERRDREAGDYLGHYVTTGSADIQKLTSASFGNAALRDAVADDGSLDALDAGLRFARVQGRNGAAVAYIALTTTPTAKVADAGELASAAAEWIEIPASATFDVLVPGLTNIEEISLLATGALKMQAAFFGAY